MANDLLIFIPTYNERENVENIIQQILALGLDADILFLDDNSPDGTGEVLDRLAATHSNIQVIHRSGKLGIGSAHLTGIQRAYDKGYRILLTMDCDFTHSPAYIPQFIARADDADIVVGSRYLRQSSISQWSLSRKLLTRLGHFLTTILLKLPYDASGAFRLYYLKRIPVSLFKAIDSQHYEFFFESLTVMHYANCRIVEFPITLSARNEGHSKMAFRHMVRGLWRLFKLATTLSKKRRQVTRLQEVHTLGRID